MRTIEVKKTSILAVAAAVSALLLGGIPTAAAQAAEPEFVFPEGFPNPFTIESGAGALETVEVSIGGVKQHLKVECGSDSGAGEFSGFRSIEKLTFTFKGCTSSVKTLLGTVSLTCSSSGAGAGEIKTNELVAKPVWINQTSGVVGIDFSPAASSGGLFATFLCKGSFVEETLKVSGSLLCKAEPLNVVTTEMTITCSQSGGVQNPTEYEEGGTKHVDYLETTGSGTSSFGPVQSGEQTTDKVKFQKKIELRS